MKITTTPFFIVLGILDILLLILSINYLFIDNNYGKALGGTFTFFGFIIFFIVLKVEQYILRHIKFNRKYIWIIESIILIAGAIYLYFNGISIG